MSTTKRLSHHSPHKLEYGKKKSTEREQHDYHGTSSGKITVADNNKAQLDDFIFELEERNVQMSNNFECEQVETMHKHLNGQGGGGGGAGGAGGAGEHTSSHSTTLSSSSQHNHDINVLLDQLAQKDKDLILAAEIGKTLLDRNEQLTKTNDEINEDYTRNLELLEQEKYALRKKLNTIEIEYENKIHELQADLHGAREKLHNIIEASKHNEAEHGRIIDELTQQNQRLTSELKRTSNHETELEREIKSLKEQLHARRINFSDHIGQIEGLRDEINLLSRRKLELESKISSLNDEKETISLTLDESQYKVLQLEKHLHEKEMFIESQQRDLDELRRMNTHYQNRIETMIKNRSFDSFKLQGSSLLNEIEMSSHSSGEENHFHHHSPVSLSEDESDMSTMRDNCKRCSKHKREMIEIYCKLKMVFDELCKRRLADHSPNSGGGGGAGAGAGAVHSHSNHDSGIQSTLTPTDEVSDIICDIQQLVNNFDVMQCVTCTEFNISRLELEQMRKQSQVERDVCHKLNGEVIDLTSKLTIQQTKLAALDEENAKLKQDISDISEVSKDEIIKRAWKMRDDVIARKNTVEIELAKVRIELMHVNSQLLETIQQKVELSQQLEQWQVDMETLIDEQLKHKLTQQEQHFAVAPEVQQVSSKQTLFERFKLPKLLRYP